MQPTAMCGKASTSAPHRLTRLDAKLAKASSHASSSARPPSAPACPPPRRRASSGCGANKLEGLEGGRGALHAVGHAIFEAPDRRHTRHLGAHVLGCGAEEHVEALGQAALRPRQRRHALHHQVQIHLQEPMPAPCTTSHVPSMGDAAGAGPADRRLKAASKARAQRRQEGRTRRRGGSRHADGRTSAIRGKRSERTGCAGAGAEPRADRAADVPAAWSLASGRAVLPPPPPVSRRRAMDASCPSIPPPSPPPLALMHARTPALMHAAGGGVCVGHGRKGEHLA